MEEAQPVQQLLEDEFLLAALEPDGIGDGVAEVRSQDVGPETLGRLVRHLHAVLEHEHGEVIGRIGSQPEAEVWVCRVRGEVLANLTVQNKLQVVDLEEKR